MIVLKSNPELATMRAAGRIVAEVLSDLSARAKPGVTLIELDRRAEEIIVGRGAKPSFKGYQPEGAPYPFPASICASVNEEIVHGIPGTRKLKDGDVLKIDCGVWLNGYHADSALVGEVGNAVFNGHLETIDAGKVFARLHELSAGDAVYVYTTTHRFDWVVQDVQRVANTERAYIQPTADTRITLYTCAGSYDPRTQDYTHRLVVVGKLVGASPRS